MGGVSSTVSSMALDIELELLPNAALVRSFTRVKSGVRTDRLNEADGVENRCATESFAPEFIDSLAEFAKVLR